MNPFRRRSRILHRAYYGTSPKRKGKLEATALHINDCLAAFTKHVPEVQDYYDNLCEYVHPNYGSNQLVSTGRLGRGRLNPPPEFNKETIDRICSYCLLTMVFLRDQAVYISGNLVQLKDLVDRCLGQGAKVSNVFTQKSALPEGDGLS